MKMETRKDSLNALKLCRFCLSRDESLTSLYDRNRAPKNSVPLSLKILSSVTVEVFPSDKMPSYICNRCKFFMDLTYEFKQICRKADDTILQFVQNGSPLESISWPPSLVKVHHTIGKPAEVGVMKTVVEGGATVQVTTQEESDSEEDDEENVYNVKIGDGSDNGSKCIKVITSTDKSDTTKDKAKGFKGFTSTAKLARHVRSHAGTRSYPCRFCDKSFLKSHHYTRHLRMKHRDETREGRGASGEVDIYKCEECDESFATQDELIFHSAVHATQNLICPLCQEKYDNVDDVTAHIKSHVNGTEFMCDFCELVFLTKEKLDNHIENAHDDELRSNELGQDESSVDIDHMEDEDDNDINVKEEDDHMVVEIKKPDEFLLSNLQAESEEKMENTNSEDSEVETIYTQLATVDTLGMVQKDNEDTPAEKIKVATKTVTARASDRSDNTQAAGILWKAEQIKLKTSVDKKETSKNNFASSNTVGASDKSLRLLEKELQELKRTNTRNESPKNPVKSVDALKNRRPQIHTSTPKVRPVEEKKSLTSTKSLSVEKKVPERRILTKENKEPREGKNITKDEKDTSKTLHTITIVKNGGADKSGNDEGIRRSTRPSKIKDYAKMIRDRSQDSSVSDNSGEEDDEYKEKQKPNITTKRRASVKLPTRPPSSLSTTTPKKRGRPRKDQSQDSSISDNSGEGDDEQYKEKQKSDVNIGKKRRASVRPPTRPSSSLSTTTPKKRGRPRKDQTQDLSDSDYSDDNEDDEEYKQIAKPQIVPKRRASVKPPATTTPSVSTATAAPRKRGRPRKEEPAKIKKTEENHDSVNKSDVSIKSQGTNVSIEENDDKNNSKGAESASDSNNSSTGKSTSVMMSPYGQTLKKVPIRSLPPGVRPLPLPINARPMAGGEVCEMQIGKKVVKVKKIVMTKAELEAMAKQGLVEVKDGTMVLKQGIKIPTSDAAALKPTLVGESGDAVKESPSKGTPTRCDLGEDS